MNYVFIVVTVPGFPISAGIVTRVHASLIIRMYGADKIKISEIDPIVKSEYKKFFQVI